MKLRIRYEKKNKVLEILEVPAPTVQSLKTRIQQEVFPDWLLSQEDEFDISLDGKTSIGEDSTLLKDAGVVSGDLVKILCGRSGISTLPSSSVSPQATSSGTSMTPAISEMSVVEGEQPGTSEQAMAGPSSMDPENDIPWVSPGPIFFQDCANESEVPHLLQQLYENDAIKTEFQALCIAIHFMMCESGFTIQGHESAEDILPLLQRNLFIVEYSHPAGSNLKFNLTCNPLGSFILINGVVQPCQNTSEQVLSLQITTNDFVKSFNESTKNNNAAAVYQNLSKLSRRFKDTISYQALNNMREELKLPPVHGLMSLFPELLLRICSHLDHKSLLLLSQVNQRLFAIASDDTLWRTLYIRDFKSHPLSIDHDWKTMYSSRFKREQERRRILERTYRDYQTEPWPQFPTPEFASPIAEPFGMIGGEHDLHPSFPYGPFATQPRVPRRYPPLHPPHPMHPDNPLPGSRFDPIYPGGGFRPGRGGGMMDHDLEGMGNMGLPGMPSQFSNRRHGRRGLNSDFRFM